MGLKGGSGGRRDDGERRKKGMDRRLGLGGVRRGEVEASTPEADKRLKESEIIEI